MIIDTATIRSLQVSFSTIFESAYGNVPTWSQEIASTIPSSSYANNYGWMVRALGRMREWIGTKVINNVMSKSYSIVNREYELTWGVRRNDLEDDNLGLYNSLVAGYAQEAGRLWDDALLGLITGGVAAGGTSLGLRTTTTPSGAALDGLAFIANHNVSGFVQANNGATENLTPGGWNVAVERMASYTDENGRYLGIRPDTLVVPALGGYERAYRTMFSTPFQTGGQSNILFGSAPKLVVVPDLPASFGWMALDTSKGLRPYIIQQRKAPTLVSRTAPTDDNVFYLAEFLWSIEARGAAGFGPYWLAFHSTGATPDGREVPEVASATPEVG